MSDIKQDVKEIVKVFIQVFVSIVVKESTKKLIKSLTQIQRKMLEVRVKNMSDDQLEQYFDKNPYFKSELENTVKSVNHIQPTTGSGSWLENLQQVCESSCIQNLIKVLIQQVTKVTLAGVACVTLLGMIAVPAVIGDLHNNTEFTIEDNNTTIPDNNETIPPYYRVLPTPEEHVLPFANFISNTTRGYVPLSVKFTDQSKNATGWKWDFGDGNNSTEQNTTHRYSTVGNYYVNLTVTNANGTDSTFATIIVLKKPVVIPGEPVLPFANFIGNVTRGYVPLSVQFTDQSENAKEWRWNFGDGNISTDQDPAHTYFEAGKYTVNLTTINTNGIDSMSAIIEVLDPPVLPVANFSSNVTSGIEPLIVSFTDRSTGNPTVWRWNFDDEGATSNEQNPVHTFSAEGTYTVNLTVSNSNDTDSKIDTIIVRRQFPPVANFSSNVTQGYAPLTIKFTDQSENATGWNWDFGGDATSTEQSPVHTFSEAGNYTVKLTVSNENGKNSTSAIIEVLKIPEPLPIRITTSGSAYNPAIYGDRIVWTGRHDDYEEDIYMYDISTSTETRITTSGSADNPAIYGDRIVWGDWRTENWDIYLYDLSTSTETRITTSGSADNPAIYGDRIVWMDDGNENSDIYMYDLSTSTETQITTDESDQYSPAIYGDRIVWMDDRNGNSDIYMYDLSTSTETQSTTNEFDQLDPAIYGDRIVWMDDRNGNSDIYMYDLSTSTETQITTNESYKWDPAIYGDRIVWNERRNGNFDIYMYNLSTSTETQVNSYESVQYTATAIYGDRIVWVSEEEGGDIYLYDLSIHQ